MRLADVASPRNPSTNGAGPPISRAASSNRKILNLAYPFYYLQDAEVHTILAGDYWLFIFRKNRKKEPGKRLFTTWRGMNGIAGKRL